MDDCRIDCRESVQQLLDYCRRESWRGYDPYDGLSSPLAQLLPGTKTIRTALIQLVKRSPLNLRPLLRIKPDYNSKGLALATRAVALLAQSEGVSLPSAVEHRSEVSDALQSDYTFLLRRLMSLAVADEKHCCWGYNFDWQSRAFFAPRGTPNVVCTAFAGQAMMDWHLATGSDRGLQVAVSCCSFLLERINRTVENGTACFSYTPLDRSAVHNVNLLAAELLARVAATTGEQEYGDVAAQAVEFTLARQRSDGGWPYGEAEDQRWMDSFHTGFVLVSLRNLIRYLGRDEWTEALARGYEFYVTRFFLADGTPGYYHDRLYPVDIHSAAQAIVTFLELTDVMPNAKELASRAARWAIENLQDSAGHFYFQRHRFYTIRTPYMRWAQLWMLYALSLYLTRSLERVNV